jgi:indoleamine 2,3-dioxygenase
MNGRLDLPPFLSYAASYALFNYTLKDPSRGHEYDNLRLVRGFERGLDPKSSEAGFILTHVDMVKETAPLIHGAVQVLDGVEHGSRRAAVNDGFREILKAMEVIEASMEGKTMNSHLACWYVLTLGVYRYVEKLQTWGLFDLPRLHLRNHVPIHVS